jgi:uncharacterized membrane protein YbhN (UPF0104 family)
LIYKIFGTQCSVGTDFGGAEAFGGAATFVTVTVVSMVGGTLASAAPTPGGVGAVEAALIGGLVAFGLPTVNVQLVTSAFTRVS